jgi:hypothetical protein
MDMNSPIGLSTKSESAPNSALRMGHMANPLAFNARMAAMPNNGIFRPDLTHFLSKAMAQRSEGAEKDGISANDFAGVLQNNSWLAQWMTNNAFQMQLPNLYQQQLKELDAAKNESRKEAKQTAAATPSIFDRHRSVSPPPPKRSQLHSPTDSQLYETDEDEGRLKVEVSYVDDEQPMKSSSDTANEGRLSSVINSLTQSRINAGKESPTDALGGRPNKRKARKPRQLTSDVVSIPYQVEGSEDASSGRLLTPGQSNEQLSPAVSDSQTSGSSGHEHSASTLAKCSCLEIIRQCESELEQRLDEANDNTIASTEDITSTLMQTKLEHVRHLADVAVHLLPVDAVPELSKVLRELVFISANNV